MTTRLGLSLPPSLPPVDKHPSSPSRHLNHATQKNTETTKDFYQLLSLLNPFIEEKFSFFEAFGFDRPRNFPDTRRREAKLSLVKKNFQFQLRVIHRDFHVIHVINKVKFKDFSNIQTCAFERDVQCCNYYVFMHGCICTVECSSHINKLSCDNDR